MELPNNIKDISILGEIFDDCPKSNPQIELLSVLPSTKNPRWIIPLKNKELIISSLALYQPSLLRAKLFKKMTVLAAKGGLYNLAIKNRVYFQRNDRSIRKIFHRDDLYYAFFTGTEGCHRKVTVQVMDEEGLILGYIKVSDNEDIDRLLKNEAEILGDLLRLEIRTGLFPKVIFHGYINDLNILVLDTLKSIYSKFSSNLSGAHISFLSEIFHKTAGSSKYKESVFARGMKEKIARLGTGRLKESYEVASDFVEGKIGNIETLLGICHRDFTPWNTFFHNNKLYVFDWEYGEKEYPPLMDLFHFIIQDGILVRHLKPKDLLKRVSKNQKMIDKYCDLIDIDKNLLNPLLLCYLLDVSLLYIEREKNDFDAEIKKKIEIWAGMIDLLVS